MDMSDHAKKKEFPAQQRERLQWQLDAIRNNQDSVYMLLGVVRLFYGAIDSARIREVLEDLHKNDRDAILQPGGIFTDDQLKILSPERFVQDTEADK
jgi:hypothetical protein